MTCCKNIKLHFQNQDAKSFQKFNFQIFNEKLRPQHRSYKMPEAKKPILSIEKQELASKKKQPCSLKNDLG